LNMVQAAHKLHRLISNDSAFSKTVQKVALQLDANWPIARTKPTGPVDVIDCFSGCGGMSAGFLAINAIAPAYRIAMAVDIDSDANATYEANIGLRPSPMDVFKLASNTRKAQKMIDAVRASPHTPLVLIGCAPCQGFSSHRNASGGDDVRNSLFIAFAKIAAAVRPDAIVIENVPEILTDRYWPLVVKAREILLRAGYTSRIAVHNMAEFGVPQQRFRALLIAMRRPFQMPRGFVGPLQFKTVRDAIGGLPAIAAGQISPDDPMHFTASHRSSTIRTIMAVDPDGGNRPWDAGPDCLRRAAAKSGRAAFEDVYGRLWWDKPAITVTAYARNPASGRYVHPEQHRGLSVREAALLQSFPKQYTFTGAFDSRFRQIGNAVPPVFAAHLAAHVLRELLVEKPHAEKFDISASLGPSFSRLIPALKAGHRRMESYVGESAG
jgi:DNA (cytosine-5)-methyltransferase 1